MNKNDTSSDYDERFIENHQEMNEEDIEFRSLIFSDSLVLYVTMCFMMLIAFFSLDRGPMIQGLSVISIVSLIVVITCIVLVFKKLLFEVYR